MYRIAIVDDMKRDADLISAFLQRYQEEKSVALNWTWISSGEALLTDYQMQYDIIFLDIRMQGLNGMDAA